MRFAFSGLCGSGVRLARRLRIGLGFLSGVSPVTVSCGCSLSFGTWGFACVGLSGLPESLTFFARESHTAIYCHMGFMRVLVGCECSGLVRDAFLAQGHDAWSCDTSPSESPGPHLQCDVREVLSDPWDIGIFFPPCTHLCVSGARWFPLKRVEQAAALEFVRLLWECKIPRVGLENPIGIISTHLCKPTQIIHPWQFGHGEVKATCLWLRGLRPLVPTNIVPGREARVHRLPPGPDRARLRSRTYWGIAQAMARQWGGLPFPPLQQSLI